MVTLHLAYHLILLRLISNSLRVSRTTCVDKGAFSLDFLEYPRLSPLYKLLPCSLPSLHSFCLFISASISLFPGWIVGESAGETKGDVDKGDGAGIRCLPQ